MKKNATNTITNGLKQCLSQEGLEVLGESKEEDMIIFYLGKKANPIFANISCTYHMVHEIVELSMLTINTFFQQDMEHLTELLNLLNIAEINNTWSVTPHGNVEIRSAIAVNPESPDKDQFTRTLKRFMECATRVYPAIVNYVSGGKTPQESMDKLVEQNKDFFI